MDTAHTESVFTEWVSYISCAYLFSDPEQAIEDSQTYHSKTQCDQGPGKAQTAALVYCPCELQMTYCHFWREQS